MTSTIAAAAFVERYHDIVAYILEFLHLSEMEPVATVSKCLADAVRLRRDRIRRFDFQGKAFGEVRETFEKTVAELRLEILDVPLDSQRYHTLFNRVRPAVHLRRLELITCRISYTDFRASLKHLRHTLRDLRIEMLCLARTDVVEAAGAQEPLVIVDEPPRGPGLLVVNGLMAGAAPVQPPPAINVVEGPRLSESGELIVMTALKRLDLCPPSSSVIQGFAFPALMRLSSYRKMLDDKCSRCGQPRPSSKCGACKFYAFCGRECQVQNWGDNALGHRRVCHVSVEADNPVSVARLILSAARSGQLRELDLAHYWHSNVLFPSHAPAAAQAGGDVDDEEDDDSVGRVQGIAVFARPAALKAFNGLHSLRLMRCGLDNEAMNLIAKNSPHLRCLDISLNTKLTDRALTNLIPLSKVLHDLRLRQNYRLTDAGVRAALVNFTELKHVDLRYGVKRLRNRHPHANVEEDLPQAEAAVNQAAAAVLAAAAAGAAAVAEANQNANVALIRQIRLLSFTSEETLLALAKACPNLESLRIIGDDEQGNKVVVPSVLEGRVDIDRRGCIEVDDFGEPDDFYEEWRDPIPPSISSTSSLSSASPKTTT